MKLVIKGKTAYIKRMYKHLCKEHPSTKKRMELFKKNHKIGGIQMAKKKKKK